MCFDKADKGDFGSTMTMQISVRVCRKCGVELTPENSSTIRGYGNICRVCWCIKSREYRKANRSELLKKGREQYHRNHARELERGRIRRVTHKKEIAEYKRKFEKKVYAGYIGICVCPKCGRRGYMELQKSFHLLTGTIYNIYELVKHKFWDSSRKMMVYDGFCFIGEHKR